MHHFACHEGRAKLLSALNVDDFTVLCKGMSPLLGSDDAEVSLTATECIRALAVAVCAARSGHLPAC